MDLSAIENSILRTRDIVVYDFGDGYVPFRVRRQQVSTLYYNFITQKANFLPLGPTGIAAPAGTQSFFQDNFEFQLQTIQNEQDMFRIIESKEIIQGFYGIAPSYMRTMLKQPIQADVFTLENNVLPSNVYGKRKGFVQCVSVTIVEDYRCYRSCCGCVRYERASDC